MDCFSAIFFLNRCGRAVFYFYSGKKTDAGTFLKKSELYLLKVVCVRLFHRI